MADFFVDVARGDDGNAGSAASPVRSIARAIDLSVVSPDETGTIFVAAGTYEPPNENFPLLMRPGYALQGAGRESTLIRFTGEVRTTTADPSRIPPSVTYWGGEALHAGRAVRDISLRASPVPPGYSCSGMIGITALVDDAVIEDVDILSPQLPEEFPGDRLPRDVTLEGGFLVAVHIVGADVTYRHSRVTLSRVGATSGGSSLLEDIRLEGTQLYIESDARVQNCVWTMSSLVVGTYDPPRCTVYGGSPTLGPGNFFICSSGALIDCRSGAMPRIDGNTLAAYYGNGIVIRDGAWASVTGNFIGLFYGQRIVDVQRDAAPYSVFEDNTFFGGFHWDAIVVEAETDFGGGPGGSRGGNHFGPVSSSRAPWSHPGLRLDIPEGGDVHAANNFWQEGRPSSQMVVGATTNAITMPALTDPLAYDDGEAIFRASFR